jgi:hypothetical protein
MSPATPDVPTIEQIRNLTTRARHQALTGAEAARLHLGVEWLIARMQQPEHTPCPVCPAGEGHPCLTMTGQPMVGYHDSRQAALLLPARATECPACGEQPLRPCTNRDGSTLFGVHAARLPL